MRYKAIIFDLDNTIYPVQSIADDLFSGLFQLLDESGEATGEMAAIKEEVKQKPFQWVAGKYGLSKDLIQKVVQLLKGLSVSGDIKPFEDYSKTRSLALEKFLVTTGFTKLQRSKIEKMGLEKDFKEIHVVDPETTTRTKKDIFIEVLERNGFGPSEVVVVGDDPESEIKAAQELGIKAILYDKLNRYPDNGTLTRITDYSQLPFLLDRQ
jgi:putative hydrolase of the HAD superfamily